MIKLKEYDPELFRVNKTKVSKQEKIVAITFVAVILLWLAPSLLTSIAPALGAIIGSWGLYTPSISGCILLFIIRVGKEPLVTYQEALNQVMWPIVILTAAISMLVSVMSLPTVGINVWLTSLLAPLTSGMSIMGVVAFTIIGAVILTNFTSNTLVVVIFYSICLPVVIAAGATSTVSVIAFVVIMSLAANTSILTPPAGAYVPLVMTSGDLTVGDNLKYSAVMVVIGTILLFVLVIPLARLLL